MQQKTVSLGRGEWLDISWSDNWSNLSIHQHGQLIGSFQDSAELNLGKKFKLLNGQDLMVLLRDDNDIEVWYQGKEVVSGIKSGQVDHSRRAINALKTVGLVQFVAIPVLLGRWMGQAFDHPHNLLLGLAAGAICGLGILFGLSHWVQKTGHKTPYWIGLLFCFLNYFAFGGIAPGILLGTLGYFLIQGIQAKPPHHTQHGGLTEGTPLDHNL